MRRCARPTSPSDNLKHVEDTVYRSAFGYYSVFSYAASVHGRLTDIGYDVQDSSASQNRRLHNERKAQNPEKQPRDFDKAFMILFSELKPAR